MTEIPDVIKIIVFSRGILKGLKFSIFEGGQIKPNSRVGDRLAWKNLQKKEKKKKISEIINKIIPHFNPNTTLNVWNPKKVLSRVISRHQVYIIKALINTPKIKRFKFLV